MRSIETWGTVERGLSTVGVGKVYAEKGWHKLRFRVTVCEGVFHLSSQSALIELRLYKSNVSANFDPEGAKQAPQSVSGARRGRR